MRQVQHSLYVDHGEIYSDNEETYQYQNFYNAEQHQGQQISRQYNFQQIQNLFIDETQFNQKKHQQSAQLSLSIQQLLQLQKAQNKPFISQSDNDYHDQISEANSYNKIYNQKMINIMKKQESFINTLVLKIIAMNQKQDDQFTNIIYFIQTLCTILIFKYIYRLINKLQKQNLLNSAQVLLQKQLDKIIISITKLNILVYLIATLLYILTTLNIQILVTLMVIQIVIIFIILIILVLIKYTNNQRTQNTFNSIKFIFLCKIIAQFLQLISKQYSLKRCQYKIINDINSFDLQYQQIYQKIKQFVKQKSKSNKMCVQQIEQNTFKNYQFIKAYLSLIEQSYYLLKLRSKESKLRNKQYKLTNKQQFELSNKKQIQGHKMQLHPFYHLQILNSQYSNEIKIFQQLRNQSIKYIFLNQQYAKSIQVTKLYIEFVNYDKYVKNSFIQQLNLIYQANLDKRQGKNLNQLTSENENKNSHLFFNSKLKKQYFSLIQANRQFEYHNIFSKFLISKGYFLVNRLQQRSREQQIEFQLQLFNEYLNYQYQILQLRQFNLNSEIKSLERFQNKLNSSSQDQREQVQKQNHQQKNLQQLKINIKRQNQSIIRPTRWLTLKSDKQNKEINQSNQGQTIQQAQIIYDEYSTGNNRVRANSQLMKELNKIVDRLVIKNQHQAQFQLQKSINKQENQRQEQGNMKLQRSKQQSNEQQIAEYLLQNSIFSNKGIQFSFNVNDQLKNMFKMRQKETQNSDNTIISKKQSQIYE